MDQPIPIKQTMQIICQTCKGKGYTKNADYCPTCGGDGFTYPPDQEEEAKHYPNLPRSYEEAIQAFKRRSKPRWRGFTTRY